MIASASMWLAIPSAGIPRAANEHIHHLAASQADDGGWTFNWLAWSPVAASEWRGSRTVNALRTLRANGRL